MVTNTIPIEQGTYALYALATPEDGDQTVEVFKVSSKTDHEDALEPGFYWQNINENNDPKGPFNDERAALDAVRKRYDCLY